MYFTGGMYMSNNTAAQMPGGIPPQMMNQQQQMYPGTIYIKNVSVFAPFTCSQLMWQLIDLLI